MNSLNFKVSLPGLANSLMLLYTASQKKNPQHYRLQMEEELSDYNNFGTNIPDTTGHDDTGPADNDLTVSAQSVVLQTRIEPHMNTSIFERHQLTIKRTYFSSVQSEIGTVFPMTLTTDN